MDLETIKNNKLKMLLQFSIPSIIAMVLTACITVADGFFVGNYVGKDAIAAINLGLPIIYLFLAVGLMISVGGSSIAGRLLGAQKKDLCINVFNQTMVTDIFVSVLLSILVFVFLRPIEHIVGATGIVATYFRDYYLILLLELPLMIINSSLGMFIRGEGNPQFYMKTNVLNVVLNIALDYVFAVPLNLGVKGIAWASFVAAAVTLIVNVLYFCKCSTVFKFAKFTFNKADFTNTILNGSSECIGELAMCVSMFAYNRVILSNIGIDGITAFTIVGYVSYLFSMVILGFGQGDVPLISFAYGAKDFTLARRLRKITSLLTLASAIAVMIIMTFASGWYSTLFTTDANVASVVKAGILIYMFSFPLAGFNTIASFYFTSIGKAKESAVISSARGLVILLICIMTLPRLLGMNGVWLVGVVTELLSALISVRYLLQDKKNS